MKTFMISTLVLAFSTQSALGYTSLRGGGSRGSAVAVSDGAEAATFALFAEKQQCSGKWAKADVDKEVAWLQGKDAARFVQIGESAADYPSMHWQDLGYGKTLAQCADECRDASEFFIFGRKGTEYANNQRGVDGKVALCFCMEMPRTHSITGKVLTTCEPYPGLGGYDTYKFSRPEKQPTPVVSTPAPTYAPSVWEEKCNFSCPAHSTRKAGVHCLDSLDQCECKAGYAMNANWKITFLENGEVVTQHGRCERVKEAAARVEEPSAEDRRAAMAQAMRMQEDLQRQMQDLQKAMDQAMKRFKLFG